MLVMTVAVTQACATVCSEVSVHMVTTEPMHPNPTRGERHVCGLMSRLAIVRATRIRPESHYPPHASAAFPLVLSRDRQNRRVCPSDARILTTNPRVCPRPCIGFIDMRLDSIPNICQFMCFGCMPGLSSHCTLEARQVWRSDVDLKEACMLSATPTNVEPEDMVWMGRCPPAVDLLRRPGPP
jgi:hypothetical protein